MAYTPENNPYIPGDPYSYDLKWMVEELKKALALYQPLHDEFTDLSGDFTELHDYVMNYFAQLDLTQEVSDKLDQMAADGSLDALIQPLFDVYKAEIDGDIAAQNAAIATLSARMDTFASLPEGSTVGNAELVDIRVGANGVTYPTAGDAVRGQYQQIRASLNLTEKIRLNRCFFIYQASIQYVNGQMTTQTTAARSRTSRPLTINAPVIVGSDNPDILLYSGTSSGWITEPGWYNNHYFTNIDDFYIVVKHSDEADVIASDIDTIYLMTTRAGAEEFYERYQYTIKGSTRFEEYGANIYRYGLGSDELNLGMLLRSTAYRRSTSAPYICPDNLDIWVGNADSASLTATIYINNEIYATVTAGKYATIPANTAFTVSFASNTYNTENLIQTYCLMITKNLLPAIPGTSQFLTPSVITRADAAFITDSKVFMISRAQNAIYSVKEGNTFIKSNAELTPTAGHANSCNFINNKVYVSDWDNSIIHVYDVDAAENTLTWNKDINIPIPDGQGDTEFFVFDDEKQIFFLGWEHGDSSTNPNTLVYGLYVLTTEGYTLAWSKKALRNTILQGFVKQGNYLYYIDNTESYLTTNIYRINMVTGETEYNHSIAGTITQHEAEAIIPIGNQAFLVVDNSGRTYIVIYN